MRRERVGCKSARLTWNLLSEKREPKLLCRFPEPPELVMSKGPGRGARLELMMRQIGLGNWVWLRIKMKMEFVLLKCRVVDEGL